MLSTVIPAVPLTVIAAASVMQMSSWFVSIPTLIIVMVGQILAVFLEIEVIWVLLTRKLFRNGFEDCRTHSLGLTPCESDHGTLKDCDTVLKIPSKKLLFQRSRQSTEWKYSLLDVTCNLFDVT